MNVLIIDTNKIAVRTAYEIYKKCVKQSGIDDWIVIPKDVDIIQNVSVDWMKTIRDKLDEKIKALESESSEHFKENIRL
jgi:hypothetical protein